MRKTAEFLRALLALIIIAAMFFLVGAGLMAHPPKAHGAELNCQKACRTLADLCVVSYNLGNNYGFKSCLDAKKQLKDLDKSIQDLSYYWCKKGFVDSLPGGDPVTPAQLWNELYKDCLKKCGEEL